MGLYEDLVSIDLILPIKKLLVSGGMPLPNTEGKIELKNSWHPDRAWVDVKYDLNRRCDVWFGVYFKYYNFVPKGCRNCWKVTVKPRNLKELFLISDIQHKTGRNSKAGIEKRDYTGNQGGYSAFWYAELKDGLEGGRKLYDNVCKDLDGVTDLKPILKRGCTEMEIEFSPSSKWNELAEDGGWDALEERLNDFFVFGKQVERVYTVYKTHALITWIEYALAHGDPSVAEFIEKESNVPKIEKYHQGGKHSVKNFKSTWEQDNNRPDNAKEDGSKDGKTEDRQISIVS